MGPTQVTAANTIPFDEITLIRLRVEYGGDPLVEFPRPAPPWINPHGGRYVPPTSPHVLPARPRQQRPRDGLR